MWDYTFNINIFNKIRKKKKIQKNSNLNELNNVKLKKTFDSKCFKAQIIDSINQKILEKTLKINIKKRNKYFYILLLVGLQMIAIFIQRIFRKEYNIHLNHSLLILLELIFFIIFSMIFLNYSLYLHQFVSFAILFLCHVIFFIQSIVFIKNLTYDQIFRSFFYLFSYSKFYCLYDVLGKKYLNTFMDGIYLFLFKMGITGLIPLLIYDLICYVCKLDNEYHGIFIYLFNDLSLLFIFRIFLSITLHISLWLIIYYFSPFHYIILDILENFLETVITLIINKDNEIEFSKEQIIAYLVLFPILFFDVLVFNEVIILNFWGLNKNTKLYILIREKKDNSRKTSYISNESYNCKNENEDNTLLYDDEDPQFY